MARLLTTRSETRKSRHRACPAPTPRARSSTTIDVRAAALGEPSPLPRFTPLRAAPPDRPGGGRARRDPGAGRLRPADVPAALPGPGRLRPATRADDPAGDRARQRRAPGGRAARARRPGLVADRPRPRPGAAVREPGPPAGELRADRRLVRRGHRVEPRLHRSHAPRAADRCTRASCAGRRRRAPAVGVGAHPRPGAADRPQPAGGIRPAVTRRPASSTPTRRTSRSTGGPRSRRPRPSGPGCWSRPTTAWRTDDAGGRLAEVALPHPDGAAASTSAPVGVAAGGRLLLRRTRAEGPAHRRRRAPTAAGFAQSTTRALRGRKLFLWGTGRADGAGRSGCADPDARYLEIQAGRCPTQLEHDVIPGGGEVSWTEAFGGVDLDPGRSPARTPRRVPTPASAVTPPYRPTRWSRVTGPGGGTADAAVDDVLAVGSGWGEVEHRLRGVASAVPALPFPEVDDDSAPVRSLLAGDRPGFEETADRLPVPPVSDRWRDVLATAGEHWWLDHARAVNYQLRGEPVAAARGLLPQRRRAPDRPGTARAGAARRRGRWTGRGGRPLRAKPGRSTRAAAPWSPRSSTCCSTRAGGGRPRRRRTLAGAVREHGRTRLQEARARAAAGEPAAAERAAGRCRGRGPGRG